MYEMVLTLFSPVLPESEEGRRHKISVVLADPSSFQNGTGI
jgi:hypothetical protein